MSSPRQKISEIDKRIDLNRRAMIARLRFRPDRSAAAWQRAWDKCPDLWAVEQQLYRLRGALQIERDTADELKFRQERRQKRRTLHAKKCPTCGSYTLAGAAT